MTILTILTDFLKISKIFRKISDFPKNFRFSVIQKIFRFLKSFQIFEKFLDFWKAFWKVFVTWDLTFETLITFLTIENNNLNIQSYPWIKSDRDGIRNSCDVFSICSLDKLADWLQLKHISAIGAEVFFQFCTNQKKASFAPIGKK